MKGKIGLLASVVVCSTALLFASAPASYAGVGVTIDSTSGPFKIIPGTSKSNACHQINLGAGNSYILQGPLDYTACGCTGVSVFKLIGNDITLDLNGFAVKGPGCSVSGFRVVDGGSSTHVTVRNGNISGGQEDGIRLNDEATIVNVNVHDNNGDGIRLGFDSVVMNGIVSENGADGIDAGGGLLVKSCAVDDNGSVGVATEDGSTVLDSMVRFNGAEGLRCFVNDDEEECTAFGNTLRGNVNCFDDIASWETNTSNNCDGVLK
jgi:hypothetical protein